MAQEIGVAYVSLLPSGKGFSKGVQNEAESAFKGAEKSSTSFFSRVVGWAKTGALVVGGMVSAVGALAIGGGISRALNIEDATAKLKGLGHDTRAVEAIMQDALASVKGTAFGLDDAASLAASAVAAGIKPGQQLERYLRLTADAATIAGGSLDDLGRVMNNVTTVGAAYNDSLQILAQKGLPIYQWLADEIGVTTNEVKNLASQGKISAETFRSAIEKNISGAALTAGETTRGSFANMLASLSRLGEAFAGPAIGAARDFFIEITKITDGIKTELTPTFEDLQYWVDGLDFNFSDSVLGFLEPLLVTINDISAAARDGSLREWFKQFSSMFPVLATVAKAVEYFQPLVPLFKTLGGMVGPVLADGFRQVVAAIMPMVPLLSRELASAIIQITPPLAELLVSILPLLPPILELVQILLPPLVWLIGLLAPAIKTVAEGLGQWLDAVNVLGAAMRGDTTLAEFHQGLAALTGPIGEVTRGVIGFAETIGLSMARIERTWNGGWFRIGAFFTAIGRQILSFGSMVWNSLPEGFRRGVEGAVSVAASLPRRIQAIFSGLGRLLFGSGQSLIRGFIDGINSMVGSVGAAVDNVLSWAAGFFPHSPAERGTFSGSGWTAVADGGASLMEQFAFGAERFKPEISFTNLVGLAGVAASPDLRMPSELVVRDVNDQLVGRMGIEASKRVADYDNAANAWARGGVRV